MSLPERLLWARLKHRDKGLPVFKRQYPFAPYVFDFYCAKLKLIIEIDGWSHNVGDQPEKDEFRDAFLLERGFEIMRISAQDILSDPDDIADGIYRYTAERVRQRH
ncbi:hypothetical protein AEYBE204_02255 [Asticcacaulis sp. YBE204]|nr:hypothetical protein AEYBE204_02255 [Asticcacaulis sp. YBE204]